MTLKTRKTTKHDLPSVHELNKEFNFVFIPGELCIDDAVVIDENNKIVGFGMIKPFAEAVFITQKNLPKATRAKALMLLMHRAVASSKEFGSRQLHVVVEDPKLGESLTKHYGFEVVQGTVLVKNL